MGQRLGEEAAQGKMEAQLLRWVLRTPPLWAELQRGPPAVSRRTLGPLRADGASTRDQQAEGAWGRTRALSSLSDSGSK